MLKQLHWLPVPQRIVYKVLLYMFKINNELAPVYLSELFTYKDSGRGLRSDGRILHVPKTKLVTFADRPFRVAGAKMWNGCPELLKSVKKLSSFKKALKHHLFNLDSDCVKRLEHFSD